MGKDKRSETRTDSPEIRAIPTDRPERRSRSRSNVGKGRAPSSDANSEIDLQAGRSNQAQFRELTAVAEGRIRDPALQAKRNDGGVENARQ